MYQPSTRRQKTKSERSKTAGFAIEPHRIVSETISGSMAIAQRTGFSRLLDKMENGDVLIVTKLDRPGREIVGWGGVARVVNAMQRFRSDSGIAAQHFPILVTRYKRDLFYDETRLKQAACSLVTQIVEMQVPTVTSVQAGWKGVPTDREL